MNIAYIRVSSKDQNPGRQLEKLAALGVEERFIFIEKKSGGDFSREQYQAMRRIIREGDLLYLDSLDRLGRNYDGIISEWKYITRKLNADIICLDNETLFDSRKFKNMGALGKLLEDQFLSLLSYLAEQERCKIRQRQREGIDLALKEGRPYGRRKTPITDIYLSAYKQWKAGKMSAVEAMALSNTKPATFYRLAKKVEELERTI